MAAKDREDLMGQALCDKEAAPPLIFHWQKAVMGPQVAAREAGKCTLRPWKEKNPAAEQLSEFCCWTPSIEIGTNHRSLFYNLPDFMAELS